MIQSLKSLGDGDENIRIVLAFFEDLNMEE